MPLAVRPPIRTSPDKRNRWIAFEYDALNRVTIVTALTVTCPDRTGRPLPHSSQVTPATKDWVEWDLLQMHCFGWRRHLTR
jgi:hypothetical protein